MSASEAESQTLRELEELLQAIVEEGSLTPAISGVAIENGNTHFLNYGFADKEKNLPITKEHLFEIGSISKTFTAMALASMVEEGKVKLDDPVQKYLPDDVTISAKNSKPITLKSLSNHTSGLPRLADNMEPYDKNNPYVHYNAKMMYDFLNSYSPTRTVGEKIEYSNFAVGLLGHVLALIDDTSYQKMLEKRVLAPLGMNSTYISIPYNEKKMLADGHDSLLEKASHWDLAEHNGAGGIKSSAQDMALYLKANLLKVPLTKETNLCQSATIDSDSTSVQVGLGWYLYKTSDSIIVTHDGGTSGFCSILDFDSTQMRAIYLVSNSTNCINYIPKAYFNGQLSKLIEEQRDIRKLPPEKLPMFTGEYQLEPGLLLNISYESDQLFAHITGQDKAPVFSISNNEFIYRVVHAKLAFYFNEQKQVESVTLHGTNHNKGFWVTTAALARSGCLSISEEGEACAGKVRRKRIHAFNISSLRWIRLLPILLELLPRFDRYPLHQDGQEYKCNKL